MGKKILSDQTREIKIITPRNVNRSHWYLLTGLVLGVIAGLIFAWLIYPVIYEDTTPATLTEDYKKIYIRIIAEVYAATNDLERATSRLNLLEDADVVLTLGAHAQRALAEGQENQARALALLASAIQMDQSAGEIPPPLISPSETSEEVGIPTQTLQQPTPEP